MDQYPEDTLEEKREFLGRAEREGWLLIFSHGTEYASGYLERRDDGNSYLRPIAL